MIVMSVCANRPRYRGRVLALVVALFVVGLVLISVGSSRDFDRDWVKRCAAAGGSLVDVPGGRACARGDGVLIAPATPIGG